MSFRTIRDKLKKWQSHPISRYYILVVEDSFSKFPEAFITTNATAEFTREALQRLFSREGIAQVIVTDNGRHFTEATLQAWLKSVGCYSIFTAPRHPCSNGQAENFVRTLKTAIRACGPTNLKELGRTVDNFLLQYRNAIHPTTKKTPAMLFKGRNLRMSNLDTTEVLFYRGNDTRPCDGLVVGHKGSRMFHVMDRADGSVHVRHRDQVQVSAPSAPTPQHTAHGEPTQPTQGVLAVPSHDEEAATPIEASSDGFQLADPTPAAEPEAVEVRRSQRSRKPPSRFDDFV